MYARCCQRNMDQNQLVPKESYVVPTKKDTLWALFSGYTFLPTSGFKISYVVPPPCLDYQGFDLQMLVSSVDLSGRIFSQVNCMPCSHVTSGCFWVESKYVIWRPKANGQKSDWLLALPFTLSAWKQVCYLKAQSQCYSVWLTE